MSRCVPGLWCLTAAHNLAFTALHTPTAICDTDTNTGTLEPAPGAPECDLNTPLAAADASHCHAQVWAGSEWGHGKGSRRWQERVRFVEVVECVYMCVEVSVLRNGVGWYICNSPVVCGGALFLTHFHPHNLTMCPHTQTHKHTQSTQRMCCLAAPPTTAGVEGRLLLPCCCQRATTHTGEHTICWLWEFRLEFG